jgi:hypothetical protein
MTDAMVTLQTVLPLGDLLGNVGPPRCSCDDQAAVVPGNGIRAEIFRDFWWKVVFF